MIYIIRLMFFLSSLRQMRTFFFWLQLSPGLALTAMSIMFGTLMVRALRPLAKDHKELENVEPEAT